MSYNISKELFKEITGNEGTIHEYNRECIINGDVEQCISINDFFFECKKWALRQGYLLISSFGYCSIHIDDTNTNICEITSSSEQQAVFDACQWILDKDKQ